jgi:hypothetical protein
LETMKYVQRIAKSYAKLKASGVQEKSVQSLSDAGLHH